MHIIDLLVLHKIAKKHHAKKLLKEGHVRVNGEIITDNIDVEEGEVYCDDHQLDLHPLKYYMINKPAQYICANRDDKDPCIVELMPRKDLHIVGRLDRDTTGLLLLTNDIKLRKRLTLPLYHIEKTYQFTCLHPLTKEEVDKANEGVVIDDNHLCECFIQMKDEKEGYITIHEGRYHEVKKIFLSLNNKILSLKRISFGHLELGHLQEGEYRHLSDDEISTLRESVYLD